jgi:hypothetical protein
VWQIYHDKLPLFFLLRWSIHLLKTFFKTTQYPFRKLKLLIEKALLTVNRLIISYLHLSYFIFYSSNKDLLNVQIFCYLGHNTAQL